MIKIKVVLLLSGIVTIALCQVAIFAQGSRMSVEIHGQVRFAEGGAPAANVVVRLESNEGGGYITEAFTDRLGKFAFTSLPPAMYSVRVRQTGYRDAQQNVDMTTTSSGLVMLQLSREASAATTTSMTASINANVPPAAQKEFDKGIAALAEDGRDKIEVAARCFEKAVSLYPKFVEARMRLGTAYMDLEQWDKAEKALIGTVEVQPKAFNALFALSEVYLREKKLDEAEKVLVQGLAIQDSSYLGHLNLARVYWEKGRTMTDMTQARPALEKAYEEVKRAIALSPNIAAAHMLKGNLLLRGSRLADAIAEFNVCLRLEPNGRFAPELRALIEKLNHR